MHQAQPQCSHSFIVVVVCRTNVCNHYCLCISSQRIYIQLTAEIKSDNNYVQQICSTIKLENKLPSTEVGLTALAWPMNLTFNPLLAMVMTYSYSKVQGQWSVGSKDSKNEWSDRSDCMTSLANAVDKYHQQSRHVHQTVHTAMMKAHKPCRSRVSFESRYGMCELFPSTSAEITLPRADRLRLIFVASFSRSPWTTNTVYNISSYKW